METVLSIMIGVLAVLGVFIRALSDLNSEPIKGGKKTKRKKH